MNNGRMIKLPLTSPLLMTSLTCSPSTGLSDLHRRGEDHRHRHGRHPGGLRLLPQHDDLRRRNSLRQGATTSGLT